MMVESQMHPVHIGQVGGDVAVGDGDDAVLHILGMHELDVVDHLKMLEQHGADQAVEIAAGDKTEFGLAGHGVPLPWFSPMGRAA